MPSFPSGAIERLPWKDLQPHILLGDTRMTGGHFAMSPLSRSLHRLRQQWNACEEWEKYEQATEDARARIRYTRTIQTPAPPAPQLARPPQPVLSSPSEMVVSSVWDDVPRTELLVERSVTKPPSFAVPVVAPKEGEPVPRYVPLPTIATEVAPKQDSIPSVKYRYREIYNEYLEARIRNL